MGGHVERRVHASFGLLERFVRRRRVVSRHEQRIGRVHGDFVFVPLKRTPGPHTPRQEDVGVFVLALLARHPALVEEPLWALRLGDEYDGALSGLHGGLDGLQDASEQPGLLFFDLGNFVNDDHVGRHGIRRTLGRRQGTNPAFVVLVVQFTLVLGRGGRTYPSRQPGSDEVAPIHEVLGVLLLVDQVAHGLHLSETHEPYRVGRKEPRHAQSSRLQDAKPFALEDLLDDPLLARIQLERHGPMRILVFNLRVRLAPVNEPGQAVTAQAVFFSLAFLA